MIVETGSRQSRYVVRERRKVTCDGHAMTLPPRSVIVKGPEGPEIVGRFGRPLGPMLKGAARISVRALPAGAA